MDYYFFAGDNLTTSSLATGNSRARRRCFRKAAFGLFMSKERYQTQKRVVEVAQTFRAEVLPITWCRTGTWGSDKDGTWSSMIWNQERYPDPAAMTKALHDLNLKLMISIWPSIGNDTELAKELDAKGLRFKAAALDLEGRASTTRSVPRAARFISNTSNRVARRGRGRAVDGRHGSQVGGACHDANGVESRHQGLGTNALGDFTRYPESHTLMTTKGTYEGQRATSNKRVLTLTRSAQAGSSAYAALAWSGDTTASWNTFRNQIAGGINVLHGPASRMDAKTRAGSS